MKRTAINPWDWSLKVGYNQAEIVEGATRQITVSGQTSVNAAGEVQHPGDMRAQLALALDNLAAVLDAAVAGPRDVTRLGIYTTDMEQAMANFDLLGARFGAQGATPPTTLLGVAALAMPGLMIEIEATAAT